jgi:hypothetical protein
MATRSDQQIALGRRPARIGRIGRLTGATKVRQYPFNDRRILDSGKRSDAVLAMTLSCPPQRRQVSMSIQASEATPKQANTRLSRCAQVRDRCRSVSDGSPPCPAWVLTTPRVPGTTRDRSGLAGANTP